MKKTVIFVALFIVPIVAYLFFALATHNSLFLSTITKNINELPKGTTLNGKDIRLQDKITILGFPGSDMLKDKGNLLNLNQKIYNKYKGFTDFQLVMLTPDGSQEQARLLLDELSRYADVSDWNFVFTTPEEIAQFHKSLHVSKELDENSGSTYVFIIDKERNLRGRTGKDQKGKEEYFEGYNTISAAEMHNEMSDDVRILLREYRLALQRNNKDKRKI